MGAKVAAIKRPTLVKSVSIARLAVLASWRQWMGMSGDRPRRPMRKKGLIGELQKELKERWSEKMRLFTTLAKRKYLFPGLSCHTARMGDVRTTLAGLEEIPLRLARKR